MRRALEVSTKGRVLRCPCGYRMEASNDGALHGMLRDHIEQEHPYTDAPPKEWLKERVSWAAYSFEYMRVGTQDGPKEEGFGPEPY